MIAADGGIDSELSRRIGLARAEFNKLSHVWRHARISAKDKYNIYLSCVVSRLTYGLQTAVLGKAAKNKLDGFHARCARSILGIQPSYWSRVSNASVLGQLHATQLSSLLLEQQLQYFGKLAQRPANCPARQLVFDEDLGLRNQDLARRRGRPRLQWASECYRIAQSFFESPAAFRECLLNEMAWHTAIRTFCRAMPP